MLREGDIQSYAATEHIEVLAKYATEMADWLTIFAADMADYKNTEQYQKAHATSMEALEKKAKRQKSSSSYWQR